MDAFINRFLFLFSIILSNSLYAQKAETHLESLISYLANHHSSFEQVEILDNGEISKLHKGVIWLQLPRKFRMDYTYGKFEGTSLIGNGENFYFYDSQLSTARRLSYDEFAFNESLFSLLVNSNPTNTVVDVEFNSKKDSVVFQLVPKQKNHEIKNAKVLFAKSQLNSVIVTSTHGDSVKYIFFDVANKNKISDEIFEFKPPEGIEFFD